MAGKRHGLSDTAVKTRTEHGRYPDGGSLYLQVTERGNRSWEYNFRLHGRRRTMGLGGYPEVSLKEARELRDEARKLVRIGVDPIAARDQSRQAIAVSLTVMQAADAWITLMQKGWGTLSYPGQIRARLQKYVAPHIGEMPIGDVGLPEIKRVLMPIWIKMRSADQIRENLEGILNWAIAEGHRDDERGNPAEWKRLRYSMPTIERKIVHYPALPFDRVSAFLTELRKLRGAKYRALELVLLCAVRTADICGGGKAHSTPMRWVDVDMDSATWTVPDTKNGRALIVPLSDSAMKVLTGMQRLRDSTGYVFPDLKRGAAVSASTIRKIPKEMGYDGIASPHGFRSSFRTWCSEETSFDKGVIEAALAHRQSELDEAYHRGSFLQKRRTLMQHWADYLDGRAVQAGGEVVALRR